MDNTPADLKYTKSHEWVRREDDGSVTVGITHHAQEQLGDMVFVEVPEIGRELAANQAAAVVESVKAASDVYSPVAGRVVAANSALADAPELINRDPFGEGWILRLAPKSPADVDVLLDREGYLALVASEEQ